MPVGFASFGVDPLRRRLASPDCRGSEVTAPFLVDATGRGTRLRRWLAEIGVTTPEPLAVDAGLGYATQLIEGGPDPRDLPGSSCRSHRSRQPVASLSPSKGGAGW